uniref:Cytochrome P450 n=1 Tax=Anopheles farauti TaxID=69004 RepID=A0A182QX92_9DIPT
MGVLSDRWVSGNPACRTVKQWAPAKKPGIDGAANMPIVEFWIAFVTTVLLTVGFGVCLILDKRRSLWVDRRFPGTGRTSVLYGDYNATDRTEHHSHTVQRLYRLFKARKWPIGGAVLYLTPCVVPTSPELIEFLLSDEFAKRPTDSVPGGEEFRRTWNAFEDGQFEALVSVASEESFRLVEEFVHCASTQPVDVKLLVEQYVARVLTRCVFGKMYTERSDNVPISHLLAERPSGIVWNVLSSACPRAGFTRVLRRTLMHVQKNHTILEELVGSLARERTEHVNFLQHLKHAEQRIGQNSRRKTFADTRTLVLELVRNVFFAASGTMIAALFEMAQNRAIQADLHEVLKASGDSMVDYLDKVIGETLRKYPPVAEVSFTSAANNRLPVGDLIVPKHTTVIIPIRALHRDEELYPDPLRFEPERTNLRSHAKETPPFFRPFGFKPLPVGANFAMLMVRVGLGTIFSKCSVRLTPGSPDALEMCPRQTMPYPRGRVELLISGADE